MASEWNFNFIDSTDATPVRDRGGLCGRRERRAVATVEYLPRASSALHQTYAMNDVFRARGLS
jgi:hypothetical protein